MTIELPVTLSSVPSRQVPLVPVRDVVIFPHTEPVLTFGRTKSVAAVNAAEQFGKTICIVTQKDSAVTDPTPEDLYQVGVQIQIDKILTIEGVIHALVKGVQRVTITNINTNGLFWLAQITPITDIDTQGDEITALSKHLTNLFKQAVNLGKGVDLSIFMRLMAGVSEAELCDQVASSLDISLSDKQQILETSSIKERLNLIISHLTREVKVLELEQSIASKTQKRINRSMREAVLRERRKTIDAELSSMGIDSEDQDPELNELRKKIKSAQMPKEVRTKAEKELKRLANMSVNNPESGYIRNYLEWLGDMPWSKISNDDKPLKAAVEILEQDHYGLDKIKERIIEFLAVMNMRKSSIPATKKNNKQDSFPAILCFAGPPGVGKTSIGKSIAKALGREFIRVSLGGVRDEAEIRGHRRTYVGAMPGRIIQGIKNAGTKNPVFMLDEIDKLGMDMRGDPSSALLEALDPEQNREFSDHYLEVPFDLSQVMFIATANMLDSIPAALRDRLEIIRFSSYTEDEKFHIAKKYLWSKQLKRHGLDTHAVTITDEAIRHIINRYTREAGVRELERTMAQICRKIARFYAEDDNNSQVTVDQSDIAKYLGPTKFSSQLADTEDGIGIATGLAYTPVGGDILFIEVGIVPSGKGELVLTGQLGQVMQESAKAAFTYIRMRAPDWGISPSDASKINVHIHVPEGAVPKDGPSAGAAIATALTSAFTKLPVHKEVAMTGEITLRGRVTEIGGLKEKLIAAHRAGIKQVFIPKDNIKDLEEIPANVKNDLQIIPVSHLDEILPLALINFPTKAKPSQSTRAPLLS